jgi:CRISPR/Cas system CMR-associated protein Cmr5 small subunit
MSDNKWSYQWKIQHNTFDTTTSGMFGKKMSEHEKQMYRIKNYKNQTLVKPDGSKQVVLTPAPAIQPTFRPSGIHCIDYEYKLIASKFPKLINKNVLRLILVVSNKNDKFIDMVNKLQIKNPENVYDIIETDKSEINIKDIINKDIKLSISNTPSLFIINGDIITEIPLEKNDTFEKLSKLIS